MSFKIPRLTFSRKQSEISDEYFLLQTKGSSQEKSISSQQTNSSLFSRDEFEDSFSQSQSEDSQCFWDSLRKLWKPEEYNEDDRKDLCSNTNEKSEIVDEIYGLLEEINNLLIKLNCDNDQEEELPNITKEIDSYIKLISSWAKNHVVQLKFNQKVLENIIKSQKTLESLANNLLQIIQSQKLNSRFFENAVAKPHLESPMEYTLTNYTNRSIDALHSSRTLPSAQNITVTDTSKSLMKFTFTDSRINVCTKTSSPNNKGTVLRMRFQKTPLSEQRRQNLRSTSICRGFLRAQNIRSESRSVQKEAPKAIIRKTSVQRGREDGHHFSNLFAPSPPDDSDNCESMSLSSLSDF